MKNISMLFLILLIACISGCGMDNRVTGDDNEDTYSISGKVLYEMGSGIKNVYVTISGRADNTANEYVNFSVPTDYRGIFIFTNIMNGAYTITPARAGFAFTPPSRTVTVNGMNTSVKSFTGVFVTNGNTVDYGEHTIYGRIVDSSGEGIAEISVGLAGEEMKTHTLTDASGFFSFVDVPNGTYTIAPGKEGFIFSPPFVTVIVGRDVTIDPFFAYDETGNGDENGFAGTHLYFPMNRDASWTINKIVTDYINGYTEQDEYTIIVEGTRTIDGKEYWMLVNDDGEFDSFVRIMNDTVYTFAEFAEANTNYDNVYRTAKPLKVFLVSEGVFTANIFDEPDPNKDELPLLLLNLDSETTYKIMSYSSSVYGASFITLTWLGTYFGTGDATVTAGNFANCKKFEIIFDAFAVGGGTSQREISKTLLWLAPNVGIVKSLETKSDGDDIIWKCEEELIGYSIPLP